MRETLANVLYAAMIAVPLITGAALFLWKRFSLITRICGLALGIVLSVFLGIKGDQWMDLSPGRFTRAALTSADVVGRWVPMPPSKLESVLELTSDGKFHFTGFPNQAAPAAGGWNALDITGKSCWTTPREGCATPSISIQSCW